MAWLAVDKDGTEAIFEEEPYLNESGYEDYYFYNRWVDIHFDEEVGRNVNARIELPSGTIETLIGRELTWRDDPIIL